MRDALPHGDRVAWLDVETTSLAFEDDRTRLLEVGLVVTTLQLVVVDRMKVLIRHRPDVLFGDSRWHDAAASMHISQHGGSGLADECAFGDQALPVEEAEIRLLRFLYRTTDMDAYSEGVTPGCGTANPAAPLWGGCSVLLDRMMLRRDMPQFYGSIHYRTLDSTSLKLAMEFWVGVTTHKANKNHRALDDAEGASKLANVYRRLLLHHVPKKAVEASKGSVVTSK